MSENFRVNQRPGFWIAVIATVIALIFLYFYAPFETFLVAAIPNARASNVIFWFASTVGIVTYVAAHWTSFRQKLSAQVTSLDVSALVFDTLQTSVLIAVIFLAGAMLQSVAMLAVHLMSDDPIVGSGMGGSLLAIVLLLIFTLLFYLLHHLVRMFRDGWTPGNAPRRSLKASSTPR
ncbi:MAG: hypothetical protein AAF334_07760 [Pseudomonadota bacterium]